MKKAKKKIDYFSKHPFEIGTVYQLPDLELVCVEQDTGSFIFRRPLERETMRVKKNSESEILPVPHTVGVKVIAGTHSFEVVFVGPKLEI